MAQPVERPDAAAFIHRPEIQGEIEFRNVTFSYPGQGEAALQNVSLRIAPGEHVVVIGRTGSGKTTLQKAYARSISADRWRGAHRWH